MPGRSETANDNVGIDWGGAGLAATGLAGISFGLIEQPVLGWSDPAIIGALCPRDRAAGDIHHLRVTRRRPLCSPLNLFARRNFAVANAQTLAMYGGIGILGFFVTIYLQQVAGYSALKSGVTGLVPTAVMFVLSARMGRLADRHGAAPVSDRRTGVGGLRLCPHAALRDVGVSVRRRSPRADSCSRWGSR